MLGAERRKRSQGDDGGGCGSGRTEREADERGDCKYIHTGSPSAREISIAHGRAPPICLVRADAFRSPSTPGQARETTICVGSALLRQCAQALGGVSTGRRSRTCFETEPPKLPLSPDPADSRSTATRSGPGACEPRAWVPPKANAGTEATVEARMLQRTSPSPVPQLLGQ